jgi:predicted transcriptional regulator of viral defense system
MKEKKENKSAEIKKAVEKLPFFEISDLSPLSNNRNFLKVLFYRMSKRGELHSLKKGFYASDKFIETIKREGLFNEYVEFVGNVIYRPSYLSLEYVLEKYGVLSETVNSITLVSEKKTNKFFNDLGVFSYRKIKKSLFLGFEIQKKENFLIAEATLAKAMFDFLYFRKNILSSKSQMEELRLNLDNFSKKDFKELEMYVKLEKSKKMKELYNYLIK